MPKYIYKCEECEEIYNIVHTFSETVDTCLQANEQSKCNPAAKVNRIPQIINLVKKQEKKTQVGQLVNEHIDSAKKEVEEYKEEMKNWIPKQ